MAAMINQTTGGSASHHHDACPKKANAPKRASSVSNWIIKSMRVDASRKLSEARMSDRCGTEIGGLVCILVRTSAQVDLLG